MDLVAYAVLRGFVGLLNVLPTALRLTLVKSIIRLLGLIVPRFRRIALRNMELAFPDKDLAWRKNLLEKSFDPLARLFVDFARLQQIDAAWIAEHVNCPFFARFMEIKRQHPGKGVVIVTGHLGSFELLAHVVALLGQPISFIVRDFKLPRVDRWWRSIREATGNRVISRAGAFREMVDELKTGRDVAVLFDQNVTRKHAVFVDWFGRQAATTKSVALAAIRTEAPVVVAAIHCVDPKNDRYDVEAYEFDFSSIYADTTIDSEEKVRLITQRLSDSYQDMIRRTPEAWFWMHRRWKTAPTPEQETVYRGL